MSTTIDVPDPPEAVALRESIPAPVRAPGFLPPGATEPLAGLPPGHHDPRDLLDHRTCGQLIPRELAAPGRYLAIETAETCWLFPLGAEATHIGRGLSAHLRIEDCHVSRRHATITQNDWGTQLFDSRSHNGTWINGELAVSAVLRSGDLIELGPLVMRYLEVS